MRLTRALKMAALLLALLFVHGNAARAQTPDPFTPPAELEKDVRFWIRVYTEVTTDQGLLHDDWNLGLVYEVLRFDAAAAPAQRERQVAEAKARYAALLKRFAAGATDDLTAHEQRILHAFGPNATPRDFRDAIDRIRFQLGQADRFHEGLIRAAVWEKEIAHTLTQHGVPAEIAALPHVESSFNLAAYSKVGAAGLWQFMPSTAKRFMRVDKVVDERLDPYSATEAAANLMLYNYRLLGTWPLAVTAYNHGPGGLRRAQDELGTQRYRRDRQTLPRRNLWLRVAQFLRRVPGSARSGPECRQIFRPDHASAGYRQHAGGIAGLYSGGGFGQGIQGRSGRAARAEPGAAAADLERQPVRAAWLRIAAAGKSAARRDHCGVGAPAAGTALRRATQ